MSKRKGDGVGVVASWRLAWTYLVNQQRSMYFSSPKDIAALLASLAIMVAAIAFIASKTDVMSEGASSESWVVFVGLLMPTSFAIQEWRAGGMWRFRLLCAGRRVLSGGIVIASTLMVACFAGVYVGAMIVTHPGPDAFLRAAALAAGLAAAFFPSLALGMIVARYARTIPRSYLLIVIPYVALVLLWTFARGVELYRPLTWLTPQGWLLQSSAFIAGTGREILPGATPLTLGLVVVGATAMLSLLAALVWRSALRGVTLGAGGPTKVGRKQ